MRPSISRCVCVCVCVCTRMVPADKSVKEREMLQSIELMRNTRAQAKEEEEEEGDPFSLLFLFFLSFFLFFRADEKFNSDTTAPATTAATAFDRGTEQEHRKGDLTGSSSSSSSSSAVCHFVVRQKQIRWQCTQIHKTSLYSLPFVRFKSDEPQLNSSHFNNNINNSIINDNNNTGNINNTNSDINGDDEAVCASR